MTTSITPTREHVEATRLRISDHFAGEEARRAVLSLKVYSRSYTGHSFEALADSDPNVLTANDLVAVSALSAPIAPEAAVVLLDRGMQRRISALLRDIPEVSIWDSRADLGDTSAAWDLWDALRSVKDLGRVRTSKLMAAKRPGLIPIYDQHVDASLIFGKVSIWALMQEVLRETTIRDQAQQAAHSAGSPHLTVLRTIDVVVWMREHGYKSLENPKSVVGYDTPLPRSDRA